MPITETFKRTLVDPGAPLPSALKRLDFFTAKRVQMNLEFYQANCARAQFLGEPTPPFKYEDFIKAETLDFPTDLAHTSEMFFGVMNDELHELGII